MRTPAPPSRTSLALLAVLVSGCVTINLYFPEKEVQDLAQRIEAEVKAEAANAPAGEPPSQETPTPEPRLQGRGSTGLFDLLLGVTPAYAQAIPEPETTNPAIRKIIESRAARLAEIDRYKTQGVIGENKSGDVEVRDLAAVTDLRARAEVQKLVRAENADREQLYGEIAAAKNIDPSQLARVRETYAETLRANARTGDWIQLPDGTWKQKD